MATTTIKKSQIRDGAIDNAKVAAGAGIATTKLADGADFLKRDGSVAATGNFNFNSNKGVNLGTPTTGTDAATKSYVDSAISNLNSMFKAKPNARAATTANINISNPGTAVFDGVTLTNGQILLVKNQSSAAENGLYTFNGSGSALTRIPEMDAWTEVNGAFTSVDEGTVNADTIWLCTSNAGGTIDSTAITWQAIPSTAGLTNSNFVDKEVPSGSINGSNTAFTLANTPVAGSEHVYLNGQLQVSGAGNDYTISGTSITYLTAPETGDTLVVSYRK